MGTYWSQGPIAPASLYNEHIGVFAGQTNCGANFCPLVKMPTATAGQLVNWFYCFANPFPGTTVPRSTLFPLTGLDADGIGLTGPNGPLAISTDGLGTIGVVLSPRSLCTDPAGSVITVVPQADLSQINPKPWVDGNALSISVGLQHFFTNVPHHDGTEATEGAVYYYLTWALSGPDNARIEWVMRLYQDKWLAPPMSAKNTEVIAYNNGALFSTTLGRDVYHTSTGNGVFNMMVTGYKTYSFTISRHQFSASIGFLNAELEFDYNPDPSVWSLFLAALDIETVATGTTNPQLGLSWNVFTVGYV